MGGGGGGGVMTGRQAATALGKLTWAFAIAFLATSITLTIIAAQNSASDSVLDRLGVPEAEQGDGGCGRRAPATQWPGALAALLRRCAGAAPACRVTRQSALRLNPICIVGRAQSNG